MTVANQAKNNRPKLKDNAMNNVIEMTGVSYTKSKGLFKKNRFKLDNISFSLPYGYICAITGANGAGKSTLFSAILDNDSRYNGNIRICDMDLRENHVHLNQKIAYISEDRIFYNEKSAMENAQLLSILYEEFDMDTFEESLGKMNIPRSKYLYSMSRGEFLRFQLAFAMAQKPALYLMDEVTAGMDPVFKIDFFRMVHEIIEDETASVIMITHIEEEITRQMDYVGIMENGKLVSFKENEAV
ncbi:MAG: ABC transporter ATP-binding protein [Pseudobutyrivibrio sp.]|nr:ABC transporter ATP-binding protein [Pseudobutyrivibrio sp.]